MKVLSVLVVFAVSFVQTAAAGIDCYSNCAACWKIGSTTGEDTKVPCDLAGGCPLACPPNYDRMHCAKQSRCTCPKGDCGDFGPCACGVVTVESRLGTWYSCKSPDGAGVCQN